MAGFHKHRILHTQATKTRTVFSKYAAQATLLYLKNAVYVLILSFLVNIIFAFYVYIQGDLKFKCPLQIYSLAI
jgi:hypothetical protein